MTPCEKTLTILGPPGVGKNMLTGSILFKYGGIDMKTMQEFQEANIRTYDEASKKLKSRRIAPTFYTPSSYHVTVLGMNIIILMPQLLNH
ncbi:hypothetical protein PVAG01_10564 [Phlyctema vagabunda]|uniref:Adenylate kinase n=1 Tax=Phlyctema vagabunda TaxID=108571 RepID=A0ABR4P2M9_9HELO